jgi:Raf kinase inhibitor-like YbhB/YbcL family protein
MTLSRRVAQIAGEALAPVRAGVDRLASRRFQLAVPKLSVTSDWFEDGAPLPARCTVDGEGVPPPLRWSEPPAQTLELVLICEDPDAPLAEPFVHWLVYDIQADVRTLDQASAKHAREGQNSKLKVEFAPAAPPPGHGQHHYHFQLFALDAPLALDRGAGRTKLLDAMEGHVIAYGELVGTFTRA